MSDRILTLVNSNDWRGLYVGEELVLEGHNLRAVDVANAALGCTEVREREADSDWLQEEGNLPPSLSQVRWRS